jgi:predicted outer membrane protein
MGLGAMAETFIVPTGGTLSDPIGGNISGSFSPSTDEEQEVEKKHDILRENLIAEINHYYEQFQQNLDNALNIYKDTICHFLDQQIDVSIHRYQARVEALNALQKHDFQHLQQAMQSYLQQLKQHQEMLQKLRKKFSYQSAI